MWLLSIAAKGSGLKHLRDGLFLGVEELDGVDEISASDVPFRTVSLDESMIHLVNHLVKRAGQRVDREPVSDSRKRPAASAEIGQPTSQTSLTSQYTACGEPAGGGGPLIHLLQYAVF
jgi:hypothetical protein